MFCYFKLIKFEKQEETGSFEVRRELSSVVETTINRMKFNTKLKRPKTTLSFGIVIICISFVVFFYDRSISHNQLVEISGTLVDKPILKHHKLGGIDYYDYDIILDEYQCKFRISDWEYRSLNLNSIEDHIKPTDTISLYILAEDKRKTQYCLEKVKTYGISFNKIKMYNLEFRNRHYKEDSRHSLFFVGVGFIICLYALVKNIYFTHSVAIAYGFLYFLFIFLSMAI